MKYKMSPEVLQAADSAIPDDSKEYGQDPEITKLLQRFSDESSMEEDINPEVISDPSSSMELKKAAIKKIRQKYLGQ